MDFMTNFYIYYFINPENNLYTQLSDFNLN